MQLRALDGDDRGKYFRVICGDRTVEARNGETGKVVEKRDTSLRGIADGTRKVVISTGEGNSLVAAWQPPMMVRREVRKEPGRGRAVDSVVQFLHHLARDLLRIVEGFSGVAGEDAEALQHLGVSDEISIGGRMSPGRRATFSMRAISLSNSS